MGFDSHSLRAKTLSQSKRERVASAGGKYREMPTHVLYVDDSGTKEYAADPQHYEGKRGNSRHFVFCGSLVTLNGASRITGRIAALKIEHFGDDTVEVKSNWLRIPHERHRHYLQPYGLDDGDLNRFIEAYYSLIVDDADLVFIAAVVDKLHMQEDYHDPWYAPAVAYELLLQRAQQHVGSKDSVAVIIDDMSGATPKGNQYKKNLKAQHVRLKSHGGDLRKGLDYSCLATQKFVNSASSQILQVSDVAAYNVYRQFLDHGDAWERSSEKLTTYPPLRRLLPRFRSDGSTGRVQGYGIVKFPLRHRVSWCVPTKVQKAAP
jgi:hypothetical protein